MNSTTDPLQQPVEAEAAVEGTAIPTMPPPMTSGSPSDILSSHLAHQTAEIRAISASQEARILKVVEESRQWSTAEYVGGGLAAVFLVASGWAAQKFL